MKTAIESDVLVISESEKQGIYDKILACRDEEDVISKIRKTNFETYARTPYNEKPNRSKYQSSDVFDQIESTFPALMGRVLATDHQVRCKGPSTLVAKALIIKARETINANDSFLLFSSSIKDGLLAVSGTVKLWWSKTFKQVSDTRPGLPQEALGFLQNKLQAGEIIDLQIEPDPPQPPAVFDPQDGVTGPVMVPVPPTFTATVTTVEVDKSDAVIVPVPPEQVLMERGKAAINDSRGCGQQTTMTVGDLVRMQERLSTPYEPFFDPQALLKAIKTAKRNESSGQRDEREMREGQHYEILQDGRITFSLSSSQLRNEITVTEWCDDVIADDKLVPALLWFGGDVCLRVQRNREGIIPMCSWSPFMTPHRVRGMGVAEQHVHNQDTRSAMGRALVDYTVRVVDQETYIIDESTDLMGLKQRVPGQLVYSTPGKHFMREEPGNLDAKLFQVLEFFKTEINDTGPSNRWTQGREVDPRNTTATGQQIMAAASSAKQNMIALVYTEVFLVDLYQKIIKLIQFNCDEFTVTVEDQTVTLRNADIQGDYVVYSETGRQFDLNDRELMRAQLVHSLVMSMAQAGLAGPQQLYNSGKKVLLAAGEPVVADYLVPPPPPEVQAAMAAQGMMGGPPGMPPGGGPPPPSPTGSVPPAVAAAMQAGKAPAPRPDRAHGQQTIEDLGGPA